jgi:MFS family permease
MLTATVNSQKEEKAGTLAWYALALLTFLYVLNFVDRVLIYLLFAPIKLELHFTDLQLALLGSTSFVIFYTLLGIPFGRISDKYSRKKLIAIGVATWSLFSGLTGFANTFWTLFFCRMMVGVGEATLGPAALSLLSDYFPAKKRATVQAVFSSAIAIGTGVAFFFGGWINDAFGWRYAFYFLGFPGLLFAILVLMLREPERGRQDSKAAAEKKDWKLLFRNVPFRYLLIGYAFFAVASNSISIWLPTFFIRVQDMAVSEIGLWIGICTVAGGLPGILSGGYFSDKFRQKRAGGRMRLTGYLALICIPLWLVLIYSGFIPLQLILLTFLLGLSLSWLGPAAADVNDVAGPHLRGLAVGIYFFVVNVIGYGLFPPLYGQINDLFNVPAFPQLMRYTLLLSPLASLIAGIVLLRGSIRWEKENSVL